MKYSKSIKSCPLPCRAFTLIEVIIALAITVIMLGGIFGIAGAAMDLAAISNRLRMCEMKHNQLCRFLRTGLLQLPPDCTCALQGGSKLSMFNAGDVFQWPGVEPSRGSRSEFRYDKEALHLANFSGDAEISSLPLMGNLTFLAFELYDPASGQWVENIPDGAPIRPSLIKIRYKLADDSIERIEVFWVPRYARVNFTLQEGAPAQ
jgi:prepilin-type N-terminal cleavage/methylation domain-containing protein